ncbi:hypothetical protein T07_14922 [Trichinella nelsoni]|uniref:Uncharacterized protein n=1 Tax=Trichinella nelsoni TaxID=6336 RepID=A0A0V0RC03_9BILA|nr:hypothetical protein T07_14922 [Trichinella nelsoni]
MNVHITAIPFCRSSAIAIALMVKIRRCKDTIG